MDREKLIKAIKNRLKRRGIDIEAYGSFEWEDYLDPDISVEDNLRNVIEQLIVLDPSVKEKFKDYFKGDYEKWQKEQKDYYEKVEKQEIKARLEQIEKANVSDLERYFEDYRTHVKSFLDNKKLYGFVVIGDAGIGKSFNLMKWLKEWNVDFTLIRGHISPLALYEKLAENKDKVVVLDDVARLIKNEDTLNILLSALDLDNRTVEWNTKSFSINPPEPFTFNGKIIVLANRLDFDNEIAEAFRNRCIVYRLDFDRKTLIEMLYILARAKQYPTAIVDYLAELSYKENIRLSLRLLEKVYPYYQFVNWKKYVWQIAIEEEMDAMEIVRELVNSGLAVKEQVRQFIERTGYSRRTYFNYKKRLRENGTL